MLAPCYLIHGGEPLQTEEIISEIAHLAANNGYNKRVVFEINTLFQWEELLNKCQNLDLFAERTLWELRLHGETVNKQGNLALEQILQQQDPYFCITVRANKLKPPTLNSNWVKHIQRKGKILLAKPVPAYAWPTWISKRLTNAGFSANKEVLDLITKCYEGNLIAAAQFIQKISTVLTPGNLTVEQIKPFIDNNTQFTIFELTNAAFSGETNRTINIFNSLKTEGIEPILILWALTREIRTKQLPAAKTKLLLRMAKAIDFTIKGIQPGNVWEDLLSMCLILSGSETLTMEDLYL